MNLRRFFSRESAAPKALVLALSMGFFSLGTLSAAGCGDKAPVYQMKPKPSGRAPAIPSPPTLPNKKKRIDDAYTIFGVVHDLHSKVHRDEVNGKPLSIVGYIVKTNMVKCADDKNAIDENCAPKCAVHKRGKADEPGSEPKAPPGAPVDPKAPKKDPKADEPFEKCDSPVPTFWIADTKEEKTEMVAVMGWASNFAGIWDAIEEYDKATTVEKLKEVKVEDSFGKLIPNPLPAVGAKVKITGTYGVGWSGGAAEPKFGIMGVQTIEILEQAAELSNLPYRKDRKKPKEK